VRVKRAGELAKVSLRRSYHKANIRRGGSINADPGLRTEEKKDRGTEARRCVATPMSGRPGVKNQVIQHGGSKISYKGEKGGGSGGTRRGVLPGKGSGELTRDGIAARGGNSQEKTNKLVGTEYEQRKRTTSDLWPRISCRRGFGPA